MSDVIDDIDTRNVLLLEQENRLAFLLAEDGDQDIGTGDFTLARALHMEYGTLQNSLEPQGWLGFALFIVLWDKWCGGIMNSCRSCRSLSRLAPQARSTVAAASLSSRANRRCSTVMNS